MQPISSSTPIQTGFAGAPPPTATQTTTRPPIKQEVAEKPSFQQLEQAARRIEKFVQPISSDLQFLVDESSGSSVVRVIDRNTQEVIRQMPSEEMLAIASSLDRLQGLLVRQRA